MLTSTAAAGSWQQAETNSNQAQAAVRLSKRLVYGWLDQADPRSGLIPRNLRESWFWNAKDAAADNFPFFLLTAFITGDHHLKEVTLRMLETEQRLTNRVGRLPDDFLFETQGFRPGPPKMDAIIFGASEYSKDGLTPITEWLGKGPWLDRMIELIDGVWEHASDGKLPSASIEVNGELLQVMSRLYWLTGEEKYRTWVFLLMDEYLLRQDLLKAERLQLDDHDCEIIGGLSEGYLVAAKTDTQRQATYRPKLHAMLDRVLEVGRHTDGLMWHSVNPVTGKVLNDDLTDNWGYNYNAFLTVAEIDGVDRYRAAVQHVMANIHRHLDFPWEGGGADGFADSIEGGINLLNRVYVESAARWVDQSMEVLLAKQGPSGVIEGWHGDGNSARTSLMYALWKTQGATVTPWRYDVRLGAAPVDGGIDLIVAAERGWRGQLRFDRARHREVFHMPFDYARINQFPEWFTVDAGSQYELTVGGAKQTISGSALASYSLSVGAGESVRVSVRGR
ncbi:MAG: hypothetical protein GY953_44875 [bacterium]|nr:hypothetical protein [bacterium]